MQIIYSIEMAIGKRVSRAHLDLTPAVARRLKWIAKTIEAGSQTEAIRRALVAFEILLNREDGSEIIIRSLDGTERTVIIV